MNAQVLENSFRPAGFDDAWIGRETAGNGLASIATPQSALPQDAFLGSYPPNPNAGGSAPGGMMSQMMQMLSQMMGMLQQMLGFGQAQTSQMPLMTAANSQPSAGPQTAFANATIASTGDPHLSIDGTLGDGSSVTQHYDNMNADPNLVTSSSFFGGYNLATQTTQPASNGVTYNQSATVTTDFGQNQVTFDNNGNATILQSGAPLAISQGQTVALNDGSTVTDNGNSLVINDSNGNGGSITTTMTRNNTGVDVSVNAQNVKLGGDVVANALEKRA
jgi:hypothetical protein